MHADSEKGHFLWASGAPPTLLSCAKQTRNHRSHIEISVLRALEQPYGISRFFVSIDISRFFDSHIISCISLAVSTVIIGKSMMRFFILSVLPATDACTQEK